MENASKALLIAAAVLIVILIIAFGMKIFNSTGDTSGQAEDLASSQQMQTFNAQFTAYEGTKKGAEVRNLVNLVNASNASDPEHHVVINFNGTGSSGNGTYSSSNLKSTSSYQVTLQYCPKDPGDYVTEPGYVYIININE